MSWPVSRILSLAAAVRPRRRGGDHPSGHTVAGCLKRPTRRLGRAALGRLRCRPPLRHSWPCFGWGLPSHSGHPECWCALTAPFHPYHREVAVCFLWHCPASCLGLPLAITLLFEVRTFLESPPVPIPREPPNDPRSPSQPLRPINLAHAAGAAGPLSDACQGSGRRPLRRGDHGRRSGRGGRV